MIVMLFCEEERTERTQDVSHLFNAFPLSSFTFPKLGHNKQELIRLIDKKECHYRTSTLSIQMHTPNPPHTTTNKNQISLGGYVVQFQMMNHPSPLRRIWRRILCYRTTAVAADSFTYGVESNRTGSPRIT